MNREEEIYEDSYGFECECAEDEFIRKMEISEEIEQLQQENKQLKELLDKIYKYCEEKIEKGIKAKSDARKVGSTKTVIKYNFKEDVYREILNLYPKE